VLTRFSARVLRIVILVRPLLFTIVAPLCTAL
jgi:hypothetical protein